MSGRRLLSSLIAAVVLLLGLALLGTILPGAVLPASAQQVFVQNGGTVEVANGAFLDLEGGQMDLGAAGSAARLSEQSGGRAAGGTLTATRALNGPSAANPAGLGAVITASANLGEVTVTRGHMVQTESSGSFVERYYDIDPSVNNSGLSAELTFTYSDEELGGLSESNLEFFKSTDGGESWSPEGISSQDVENNTVTLSGIESLGRWALSEPALLAPEAPTGLRASTGAEQVDLTWEPGGGSSPSGYNIYRLTSSFSDVSSATKLNSSSVSSTSYADEEVGGGTEYFYRVTAVDSDGQESPPSAEDRAFFPPQAVEPSVARSFGDASGPSDYRLVALPGRADTSLAAVLKGKAGAQWQAFLHDSSQEDALVRYDGSEAFRFGPGRGFWVSSTERLTFEAPVPAVELKGDTAATIGLQEGWNVISNPLGKDVAWSEVEVATGTDLQPIWAFDGSFGQEATFTSAREGGAYYFFNEDGGPDSLVVPYPGAPEKGQQASSQIASQIVSRQAPSETASETAPETAPEANSKSPGLALSASAAGHPTSKISVGLAGPEAGEKSVIAPPGRFEAVSLRIVDVEAESPAAKRLMAATRPSGSGGGHTFHLRLTSRAEGPVELSAEGLQEAGAREARLLRPSKGETYDLREEPTVTIKPEDVPGDMSEDMPEEGRTVVLRLAVGAKSYVEDEAEKVLPDEISLTSYPNPVQRQGTLEYALPEASEVSLKVYDVLGREVATVEQGRKQAGRHQVTFEAERLPSGAYFGHLEAGGQTRTQKITVVR